MNDALAEYAKNDAALVLEFQKQWDLRFIRVGAFYYDRQEWERYCLDKKRWALEDPTVVVQKPLGFR